MIDLKINKRNLLNLLLDMRAQDKEELSLFIQKDLKKEFVKICLNSHETYFLGTTKGKPIAIGGVTDFKKDSYKIGQVWLLASNESINNKIGLYKYVKNKIESFKQEYDILYNYIYKTNFSALIWLKKFGFRVLDLKNPDFKLFYFSKGENNFDIRYCTC